MTINKKTLPLILSFMFSFSIAILCELAERGYSDRVRLTIHGNTCFSR